MKAEVIRERFISFFKEKGHKHVAAAPIVNKEDPTLMFTNAGMNQFKDLFLGHQSAPYQRAVSVQPCLRVSGKHNDLEEVGTDTYHHTMFEMLGNWSFGDYFKQEAIQWAWELLTTVYQLPQDRLYVTIFGGDKRDHLGPDQETRSIWKQYIALDRILPFTKQDNFWEMGDTGPCGPCTEIHIDMRPEAERQQLAGHTLVNKDHPKVIELWNLVFIQYNRLSTDQLEELPNRHVDTGLGLERLAMVLQAKQASYDTDLLAPLLAAIATAAHQTYGKQETTDIAMRVIADHLRAVTFAIADGQSPSNTKAGYVIRRILRRAVRYGYTYLGFETPFIYRLVGVLAQQWRMVYPHIAKQQAYIAKVIEEEEQAFLSTLTVGLHKLDQNVKALQGKATVIDGTTAFELYDTYGFPLDLTVLLAKERGFGVDEIGFSQALDAQRQRSKQAAVTAHGEWVVVTSGQDASVFVGYDRLEAKVRIVKYRTSITKGKQVYHVVLDQTPFYPEGGGQVGDTGQLIGAEQETIPVLDTKKEHECIMHHLERLPVQLTAPIQAVVDRERRMNIANNHTATHLLHAALKQVLGPHVAQRGSFVNDQLLRFDFSHATKLTSQSLSQIEHIVNQKIRNNIVRQEQRQLSLSAAKSMGALALFGEKYGHRVRVITFDPTFSIELCGGIHVPATGQIGFFKITTSTSVAAGVRRIEAVTAMSAERLIQQRFMLLDALQALLKYPKDLHHTVQQLLQDKTVLSKQLAAYETAQVRALTDRLRRHVHMVQGIHILIDQITLPNTAALKQVALALQGDTMPFFAVLATSLASKPYIAVVVSKDLAQKWPQNAQIIVNELAAFIQGRGGGSATFSIAGGTDASGIPKVLQRAKEILKQQTASVV